MAQIPFDSPHFHDDDLEEFVARFLDAGISLTIDGPDGLEERRVLRAFRADKSGGVVEGGVDVIAKMEGGETWGFECKLYTRGQNRKWKKSDSETVLRKATYPADRFFLIVVTNDFARDAVETIEEKENWEFWHADNLSSQFLTRVPFERGLGILSEFFDKEVAADCYGMSRDEVLVHGWEFFASTSNPDRPFNHLSTLVGRSELLSAIYKFVEDSPKKKVLLIAARGGEGKSRTLAKFASEFDEKYPEKSLRFVNPLARDSDFESSLAFLLKRGLVAVHEDAHRTETLRRSLLGSIGVAPNAKLILTTRPQGIQAIREILKDDCGITIDDIEVAPPLPPLNSEEMTKLATEVLGPNPEVEPHVVVGWADRSPLVCVVGGNLIRQKELSPNEIRGSEEFRAEVFDRFEQQNLRSLSSGDLQRLDVLKKLLRAMAVLAPYPSGKEAQKKLSAALNIPLLDLDERIRDLVAAELVVDTDKGWRVGPDLFADHLVFTSCVDEVGDSTIFCDQLIEHFGADDFPRLLRNLSEAEWKSRLQGNEHSSLTEPLWERFLETFKQSSFRARDEMLGAWSAFSFFLPEKSIELAKHAIIESRAPDEEVVFESLRIPPSTHLDVVKKIPPLLKPLGIYQLDFQAEVFDILGPLGRNWSNTTEIRMREEENHPWVVIAKAASFAMDQPLDSVEGVIRWLRSRWDTDWISDVIDQRGPFLSLLLEPVFKRVTERTIWQGRTAHFQTFALSVKKTAPARDAAFDLIKNSIIPRGEIATLNAIPVLNAASAFWDGATSLKLDRAVWRLDRLRAIHLLGECRKKWNTPFVKFLVWQSLTGRVHYESDKKVVAAAKDTLSTIEQDTLLKIAFSTLGDDGNLLLYDDLTQEPDYEKSWHRWKAFHPALAAKLLGDIPEPHDLIDLIEDFEKQAHVRGFFPNWGSLVGSLVSHSSSFAAAAIEKCFTDNETVLDRVFGIILLNCEPSEDSERDRWMAQAIQSTKKEMQRAALRAIRWGDEPPGPSTRQAIIGLLNDEQESSRRLAIETLSEALNYKGQWALDFIESIPFPNIEDQELMRIASSLVKGERYGGLQVGFEKLRPILDRMVALESIWHDVYQGIIRIAAREAPGEVFRFVRKRIKTLEKRIDDGEKHLNYSPTPFYTLESHWRIPGLGKVSEYTEIVNELALEIRKLDSPSACYWQDVFQAAVLLSETDQGVRVLSDWLNDTSDPETVATIAEVFNVTGSSLVFHEPDFLKQLLEKSEQFDSKAKQRIRNSLIPRSNGRAYSNGVLNKEYHWVLDEARKAASKFADDLTLKTFFEDVVAREERDRERNQEWYYNDMLATG
jgi:hypothetical protein